MSTKLVEARLLNRGFVVDDPRLGLHGRVQTVVPDLDRETERVQSYWVRCEGGKTTILHPLARVRVRTD